MQRYTESPYFIQLHPSKIVNLKAHLLQLNKLIHPRVVKAKASVHVRCFLAPPVHMICITISLYNTFLYVPPQIKVRAWLFAGT